MGYRTVVMLNNDLSSQWSKDAELGRKIIAASNNSVRQNLGYGSIVECVHADTQTIAVLDGYDFFDVIGSKQWQREQDFDERNLELLKIAADKLGYRLVKKPVK